MSVVQPDSNPAQNIKNEPAQVVSIRSENVGQELFTHKRTSRSRIAGFTAVILLLLLGTLTFAVLIGLTPVKPTKTIVITAAVLNGILVLLLLFLISKEVVQILRSRKKGRAASRLHVRIIGLFCIVAAIPAILVAIIAGVTLNLRLDRWFEFSTKNLITSSVSIARAYQTESTRVLMGNALSMAANLDRNKKIYNLDRGGFKILFTREAGGRGFLAASIVKEDGTEEIASKLDTQKFLPEIPGIALDLAKKGNPVPIPPGNSNFIGVVYKLQNFKGRYLYAIVAIPPAVINALKQTELNSAEYVALEQNKLPYQFAFGLLYFGVCLIVLICAIWMGISVATRIVTPIRRLMFAASEVSSGNMDVQVDVSQSEGDLRFLSETFNVMLTDLSAQQSQLVDAKELMDQRASFIEAVLSGVSAAVIGLNSEGIITIANRSAKPLLGMVGVNIDGTQLLADKVIELGEVIDQAIASGKRQYREQVTLLQEGRERTLNVQVTVERKEDKARFIVLTLDDITDLVSAQRNTAWADVARRIAHEIKNPLTPIQLSAERIRRRYGKQITDDREIFDKCTDTIIRQVGDIGRMVDEFSAFARMPAPEMALHNIANTVRETVFLQKVGFPEIEFEMILPQKAISTVYDERMISQALINVIKNAAESVDAVQSERDFKGKITVKLYADKGFVNVDVIDNGIGLPEQNRQQLLEPYMTTREKGTGLGLAIVRKIAEDHGGRIDLMDSPEVAKGGHGAMMRLQIVLRTEVENSETKTKELG